MTNTSLVARAVARVGGSLGDVSSTVAALTVVAALSAACWAGCKQQSGVGERVPIATSRHHIINGTPDTSAAHQAVVLLYDNWSGGMCSGTLISSRAVLTAGHCVSGNPTQIDVFVGNDMNGAGQWYDVSEGQVHPGYDAGGGTEPPRNDVALLRLSSTPPVTVIPVLPPAQKLTSADVYPNPIDVVFVGFGQDEDGQSGVKLTITRPLSMLCFGPEDCFFVVGNAGGILAAKTIGFDISPGGPCSGDSGGPVLVDRSGTEYVAGINSYVGQNCDSYAASTLTDGHWSFIQNFIGNGPFEVCEGGYDEDGDGMVDCNDSDCSQDTTCIDAPWTTADVVCNPDTHPCPDGSACIVLTSQPNWPEGAGICAPTCSQPGATNGECLEETSGLGLCGLSGGFGSNCVLYCGSAFGESCPSGFTCRDFDNGAANPQQGLCVPDRPPSEPNCADGLDEDQDGLTDCDDPDCADDPDCSTSESCTNGVDDDGDGDVDCDDSDCQSASVCNQNEVCDNGSDDDGDGLIDCDDSDCDSASVCDNVEICTNGTDDDGDGDVDCADSDCSSAQVCNGNEDCFNEVDDDGDGLVDCQDPECATAQHCSAVEICDNGSDDDGDGRIDCADADCNGLSGCQPAGEEDSGCSCRAASAGTLPGPGWVLIFAGLLGAMLFGRRKRRLHR